jgi:hypothetical protein
MPATGRQPAVLQPGVLADKILDDVGGAVRTDWVVTTDQPEDHQAPA